MRVGDALYRAYAIGYGQYELIATNDDELRKVVATKPCMFPEQDDGEWYPWIPTARGWLDKPYSWFQGLPADDQQAYLDDLASVAEYADPEQLLYGLAFVDDVELVDAAAKPAGDKWVSPGRLVLTWPDLDPTAQLVLFVMAAHGDNNAKNIYISQSTIAEYLGFASTEPVRRAYRRLERSGAITRTKKPTQHRPGTYRINRGSRVV